MSDSQQPIPRRGFVKVLSAFLGVVGLGVLAGPAIAFFWPSKLEEVPSEPVKVGAADSRTIRYGRYPALVIQLPEGVRAYSAICTHFACLVKYNRDSGEIECPCHAGYFNASDGSVLSGPPPKELEALPTFVKDNILYLGSEA
jgi:cytochrome b6-f complex iron-sulfur subunit